MCITFTHACLIMSTLVWILCVYVYTHLGMCVYMWCVDVKYTHEMADFNGCITCGPCMHPDVNSYLNSIYTLEIELEQLASLANQACILMYMFCNLKYKVPNFFPVIFHNLSGYDSHLFIKREIAKMIFLVSQIMKKTTFLSRNRSSLTNLLIMKEER